MDQTIHASGDQTGNTLLLSSLYVLMFDVQVWNVNPYSRFVGVFHVQGSSWDRTKRSFSMHSSNPRPLQSKVQPTSADLSSMCLSVPLQAHKLSNRV